MKKMWLLNGSLLFILFFAQSLFAEDDEFNLTRWSNLIVRGTLHFQQKTVKYPSGVEYPVPFRLEIEEVFKGECQEPKQIEITDNYYEMCHTYDSVALTKKFQVLDGKEVLAFIRRIPPCKYEKTLNKKNEFLLEYMLGFSDLLHPCAPSPNALRLFDPSQVSALQVCLHPTATPTPVPGWEQRVINKADFSFLKNAKKWTFAKFDYFKEPKSSEEPVPEEVLQVFRTEAKEDFKNLVEYDSRDEMQDKDIPDPQKIYSPICVFDSPGPFKVYSLHIQGWSGVGDEIGNSYVFVIYDTVKKKVCQKPIDIDTRWGDIGTDRTDLPPTVVKPLIDFTDCFGTGSKALVVEDIEHNGTWTAVMYHYYEIGPDSNLVDVLDLETRNTATGKWWEKGYTEMNQTIVSHKNNEVTVLVTMEGVDKPVIEVGTMVLGRKGPCEPFKIVKKNITNNDPNIVNCFYLGSNEPN
jgi:hypothetical protein